MHISRKSVPITGVMKASQQEHMLYTIATHFSCMGHFQERPTFVPGYRIPIPMCPQEAMKSSILNQVPGYTRMAGDL